MIHATIHPKKTRRAQKGESGHVGKDQRASSPFTCRRHNSPPQINRPLIVHNQTQPLRTALPISHHRRTRSPNHTLKLTGKPYMNTGGGSISKS